jgi:hypothetical protein
MPARIYIFPSCSGEGAGVIPTSKEREANVRKMRELRKGYYKGTIPDLLCILAGIALIAALGKLAQAQTDLTGYWVLHVTNGDGTVRDTYLQLSESGEAIHGTLFGRGNGTPIEGTFKEANCILRLFSRPLGLQLRL